MTAKDLHFSFDTALAQAQPDAAGVPESVNIAAEPASKRQLPPVRAVRSRPPGSHAKSDRWAWLTASFVALVNMAFLVLAALWLTGNTYELPGLKLAVAPAAKELDSQGLEAVQASLQANAAQLTLLGAELAEQSELLVAIQAQLARAEASAASATSPVGEVAVAQTDESSATPIEDWQINLGSFTSAEGAERLQAELASMGYVAQVGGPEAHGESAYRVWLGGYENREAADSVANQLMDKTSLSGLWVWSGH